MRGGVVGQVVASNHPGYAVGDYVEDRLSWEEYAIGPGPAMRKIDPALGPLPAYNTVLGMTGMTAYFGLFEFARAKPGETVLVSGATGGVGSLAAQIAKIAGCRVIGVAGGSEKCGWLTAETGLDGAIDYKAESDLAGAVKRACPQGVDVYFDCTGGPVTDAAFANMALHGRVVFVGGASHDSGLAPRQSGYFVGRRLSARGFIIFDHTADWGPAVPIMAAWLKAGRIKTRDEIVDGLEKAPDAFVRMQRGDSRGKLQVRVATA
jgi:NADPH-dependent curcumin reductase CurA